MIVINLNIASSSLTSQTSMHHALHIEEILVHIFSFCNTIKRRRSPRPARRELWYANGYLVTLAGTCKTFKEPALDMIWAELNDLTPLVRCLPATSWVESEGVSQLKFYIDV